MNKYKGKKGCNKVKIRGKNGQERRAKRGRRFSIVQRYLIKKGFGQNCT